jgi:hypothetical protein
MLAHVWWSGSLLSHPYCFYVRHHAVQLLLFVFVKWNAGPFVRLFIVLFIVRCFVTQSGVDPFIAVLLRRHLNKRDEVLSIQSALEQERWGTLNPVSVVPLPLFSHFVIHFSTAWFDWSSCVTASFCKVLFWIKRFRFMHFRRVSSYQRILYVS